ncbi:helix-turn-helix domain-containing protein [Paenibacillus herberti]|uniref:Transcriptional regulator n=1 Tax=Paenibacillus herberti TaxID=1619309 RepID=A0A229NTC6_9BACL|nr:helix-turn-helix transcriptional regulator [Paenibacillus herberti]OXM13108.1 transcriptional regulator [Paenibacillus herberti]
MFAKRLKALRKKRKLTMQEVADFVGVAKSTYAGYESGYRQPTLESIQTIARRLNTTSDYLLGLTEYAEPVEPSSNAREWLNLQQLHWDGIPLEVEDVELIRLLLERVVRERVVRKDETGNG